MDSSNPSKENRLLVLLARTEISEPLSGQVKSLLEEPLIWDDMLTSAQWHGVAPFLYKNLMKLDKDYSLPEKAIEHLKRTYTKTKVRNIHFYSELQRVLEVFHNEGVNVIVLKGAALAEIVYGDIALRPMSDIDLLVKKEDLSRAESIMSKLGYLFSHNAPPEWYKENHYHIRYTHPEKDIRVEVHWHISDKSLPYRIRVMDTGIIERWWERAQAVEISGKKAFILSPEDLLLHLSLHFLKHRFMSPNGGFTSRGTLIQLCDIFQTLKHYRGEINWTRLRREAEEYRVGSLVYSALYLVKEIMGDQDIILHDALSKFTPVNFDKEKGLVELIQKRIFIREYDLPIVPPILFWPLASDTFQKKAKTLIRGIFPHPESLSKVYSMHLSPGRLYLYYLIRPFTLLLKYRRLTSEIPRIKEDVTLNKWVSFKD